MKRALVIALTAALLLISVPAALALPPFGTLPDSYEELMLTYDVGQGEVQLASAVAEAAGVDVTVILTEFAAGTPLGEIAAAYDIHLGQLR